MGLTEVIGREAVERVEARQEFRETTHTTVWAEYREMPDFHPAVSVAGYEDVNRVQWLPLRGQQCTLTHPECHRPSFLYSDGYGYRLVICEPCFRQVIYTRPKHVIKKWIIARAIEQGKLRKALESQQWILKHAYNHTLREAYVSTRN